MYKVSNYAVSWEKAGNDCKPKCLSWSTSNSWAVVGLRVNLIHNSVDRVIVFYELKRETIKDSINQSLQLPAEERDYKVINNNNNHISTLRLFIPSHRNLIDMAIISLLFDSIQFNSEIKLLN